VYNPRSYRNDDIPALHDFIERYNFASLFTHRDGANFSTHLPFMVDRERGALGTLVAHMARANPHWRHFEGAPPSLVVFSGPHAYISPAWYIDQVTVPTWNYTLVHATGDVRLVTDEAALRAMVLRLVAQHEAPLGNPWDLRQADEVMDVELAGIVGFEIPIDRLEGKFKLNQNRSLEDRESVIRALENSTSADEREIARLMRTGLPRES
jgi:transcriptional regulator